MKSAGIFLVLFSAASFLDAQILSPNTNFTTREEQIIAAAKAGAAPRFNGALVVGVRPGTPFLHSLAVSGERPMSFAAENLPAGLSLDSKTGIITGSLAIAGEYSFKIAAKNSAGKAETEIKIVCGDKLALTPPMGWNSYDAFGDSVVESEVLSNALWLKEHLQPFGWDTVVVDFRWYDPEPTGNDSLLNRTRLGAALVADEFGRLLPATNRFPSAVPLSGSAGFKPLADKLHSIGLRFGIHVMRGIPRQAVAAGTKILNSQFTAVEAGNANDKCVWCPDMFGVRDNAAAQAWYDSCARLWAGWGVDYIKVDDLSMPYHVAEVEMIRRAIDRCGRDIIFSTSPGPTPTSRAAHVAANANLWRISGDFWDRWPKIDSQFDLVAQWQGAGVPGHWPDADMIPLGHLCLRSKMGGNPHWTHFTRDEQVTLMSLWALAPSPLMLGMNLPDNDEWTTALLANLEVLAVNQDALGKPARRMFGQPQAAEMWVKDLSDGTLAVGFFNRTDSTAEVNYAWRNFGFLAAPELRDLWLRKDLAGRQTSLERQENFISELPPHGCMLLRVKGNRPPVQ